jgi:hypothetical protein
LFVLGDVNGDGIDDVIIGALTVANSYSGAAYVVFGSEELIGPINLTLLSVLEGFVLIGTPWSWFGYSVSGAGEFYFP